jgi:hypothetical protein
LALAATLLLVMSACGGGGGDDDPVVLEPNQEAELTLTLTHTEPLKARAPVTWTIQVRNAGQEAVTLTFGSGQRGDVVLAQGAAERYRWSKDKAFTQALIEVSIGPGQAESFEMKDDTLEVEPGQYDLVASLKSQLSPTEVRQAVIVSA